MPTELNLTMIVIAGLLLLLGMGIGALLSYFWRQSSWRSLQESNIRLQAELDNKAQVTEERDKTLALARGQLAETFDELAQRSLRANSDQFLRLAQENLHRQQKVSQDEIQKHQSSLENLVKPLKETLNAAQTQIKHIESERYKAYGQLSEQLMGLGELQRALTAETHQLSNALRNPAVRGKWGEMHLRRLIELAGLVEHCDFELQKSVKQSSVNYQRPDALINLPEGGHVVIDAKTVLTDYLDGLEAGSDTERNQHFLNHAKKLKARVKELSAKEYWEQFHNSPDYVILYLPGDQFLSAAMNADPNLLDEALAARVVLATPGSLFALLKALAHGWRQINMNENVELMTELAEEFQREFHDFIKAMAELGQGLNKGLGAYNKALRKLEEGMMPKADRLSELGATASKKTPKIRMIHNKPRAISEVE